MARDPYLMRLLDEEHARARAQLKRTKRKFRPLTDEDRAALDEMLRRHEAVVEEYQRYRAAVGLPAVLPEHARD